MQTFEKNFWTFLVTTPLPLSIYYGLTLNIGYLPGSTIFNNAILGVVDIPGELAIILLMEKKYFGRRFSQCIFLTSAGLACLISTILLEQNSETFKTLGQIFALIGKFFVAGSFQNILQYASEIYSSDVRPFGFAFCSFMGRVGGILCPFIVRLGSEVAGFWPGLIFGLFGVVAGILCYFLPETLGKPMFITVEEMKGAYR